MIIKKIVRSIGFLFGVHVVLMLNVLCCSIRTVGTCMRSDHSTTRWYNPSDPDIRTGTSPGSTVWCHSAGDIWIGHLGFCTRNDSYGRCISAAECSVPPWPDTDRRSPHAPRLRLYRGSWSGSWHRIRTRGCWPRMLVAGSKSVDMKAVWIRNSRCSAALAYRTGWRSV